ncbi:unnamed protein product [Miscanthus lutarioriparius]|uniref:Uncharacterized protein n=1 Tax=Miscanthus lutarioriparius TaxID=422564 RepID=A0A811RJ73_9POAL|nr:unnamed protein product [Miscanthus lutarioriparius]
MADHQQSSEAVAKAAAAASYSRKQIADSMAFIDEILPELAAAPDVRHEFLRLLSGLGKDGGDADAVGSRAAELLRGHPDVLRRFIAHVHADAPQPQEDRKEGHPADPGGGIGSAAKRRRSSTKPPWGRRPPVGRRRRAGVNVRQARARNRGPRGPCQVHGRAVRGEGQRGHGRRRDLRQGQASVRPGARRPAPRVRHRVAPGEAEWKLQQQARGPAARQRSRAAAASSHAAAGMPGAKKPRADDDGNNGRRHEPAIAPGRQRNRAAASSHAAAAGMPDAKKPRADGGNNGRQHDHVIAVLEVRNVQKRRSDDDGTARGRHARHRIGESSGGGAAEQGCDDDYDYAPQTRAKKPHSGNGELSGSLAAAQVLGADASGVHHAYSGDNKKPPRRRAASGGKSSSAGAGAGRGRSSSWSGTTRSGGSGRSGSSRPTTRSWCPRAIVSRSCCVLLVPRMATAAAATVRWRSCSLSPSAGSSHNYYGDRWGEMRAALERGESRVPALEAI